LPFGGTHSIFVPMTGAPFLRDLEDVRRWPTIADLNMFHKLAHMSPALHSTAHHIVEPMDMKVSHRHLAITYSSMKYSDKTFMGMTTSGKNAEDVMAMCEILFGAEAMEETPVVTGNCNGNSPLVWDEVMLSAMRAFCRRNQPVLCSPFVLGGANTPASVAPAVAQLNAEALSALAYTQVVRKGCPAIYGHYLSTVSMKSGAPMAGTTEISLMNFMIGQMARFYGVPWRTSNLLGGAKTFDAQAGYESAMTMDAVLHAGANYIWHSAGWNEAGMQCSVAKFVVDAEVCAMGYRMAEGPRWDDFDEAMQAVRDVGPGGITWGTRIRWKTLNVRSSCRSFSTTTASSSGRPRGRSRSPSGRWPVRSSFWPTMRNRSLTKVWTRPCETSLPGGSVRYRRRMS
jgi:trimethylamine---corrinoid protein Co-methyltransferase